jgi:DNA-directed RNA polymerase subunit RPC12/RpoP
LNNYRYKLDTSPRKYSCPACGKKRFVKYVDTTTGELLPQQYGRCDREAKCGYHLNPYKDGYSKMIWQKENGNKSEWKASSIPKPKPQPKQKPVFMPSEVLQETLKGYDKNNFIQFLLQRFPDKEIERVISLYYLGTIIDGYRTGAITFPFIDVNENIRAIQVKQFDKANHATNEPDFIHSMLTKQYKVVPQWLEAYNNQERKVSCLFGEHLLRQYPGNPIALVEAPKTAIYGTLYFGFPDNPRNLLWLGVFNLSSLSFEKIKVLQERRVVLFPDLSKTGHAFKLWATKAKEFNKQLPGTKFVVSDLLENNATQNEKEKGLDFADYLIKFDASQFRPPEQVEPEPEPPNPIYEKDEKYEASEKLFKNAPPQKQESKPSKSELWPVDDLEKFFNDATITQGPIKLNDWETIANPQLFIENQLAETKAHNGQLYFRAGYERLVKLKSIIEHINNTQNK